ncbi:MAG: copper chaperone PCu(A)C [Burkholderiaceae bacterium]|nr:MAG: copper chaperone PCu(A)C [Burkholderiaceae bacterium]
MKLIPTPLIGVLCTCLSIFSMSAQAHEYTHGALQINHPWVRASIPGASNGAAYIVNISNHGKTGDALIKISTPIAHGAELHQHIMEGSMVKMFPVKRIDIPAGGSATLSPGGYHIMLFGLKQELKTGERYPMTLTFAKAGRIEIEVKAEDISFTDAVQK